jgi:uncharacterized membrane protein
MEAVKSATEWLSTGIEAAAALVIGLAVIEALLRSADLFVRHWRRPAHHGHEPKEDVRLRLGKWLAVALELLLAADILQTAVAPSWDDIGRLAAIAAIRTVLNVFLQRDIDAAASRRDERAADTG